MFCSWRQIQNLFYLFTPVIDILGQDETIYWFNSEFVAKHNWSSKGGHYGKDSVDSGDSQLMPPTLKDLSKDPQVAKASGSPEADIIEQMAMNRLAYRRALEALRLHYKNKGDNMKLNWAENEIKKLNKMPQYNYIVEAGISGPQLKATKSIRIANYIYDDARRLEKKARMPVIFAYENKLRACQWDPKTPHPAKFREAYVLDQGLSLRAEALELYKQAIGRKKVKKDDRKFAEKRISEITKTKKVDLEVPKKKKK